MATRWPEAIALKSVKAESVAEAAIVKMPPYHLQSNGVLERVHSNLEAMLAKAHSLGQDWMQQLPQALFALRQCPNCSGYSPYKLVYGHHVRIPLDILYEGWRGQAVDGLEVQDWVEQLSERLELARDYALSNSLVETAKRKHQYDKGSVARELEVGSKVFIGHQG